MIHRSLKASPLATVLLLSGAAIGLPGSVFAQTGAGGGAATARSAAPAVGFSGATAPAPGANGSPGQPAPNIGQMTSPGQGSSTAAGAPVSGRAETQTTRTQAVESAASASVPTLATQSGTPVQTGSVTPPPRNPPPNPPSPGAATVKTPASTGANQVKSTRPAVSGSVIGIPVPTIGNRSQVTTPVEGGPAAAPVQNYYGDNTPGTYANTDTAPGAADTMVPGEYGPAPNVPIKNPNSAETTTEGVVSNGTGQPLYAEVAPETVATPAVDTGLVENPQESGSAIVWIVIFTVVILGGIFGMIKWTQPGGQA